MGLGLQVREELIKTKTFKIQRALQVWEKMMNSIDSLLSLGGPDRNSKRSLPVTHMPHCSLRLCPSYEWTSGQTHGHMSLGANPPLLSVLETHLLTWPQERALGSIGKIPCRSKWQPNPIFFFWKISQTEEYGGLQPRRSQKFQTWT